MSTNIFLTEGGVAGHMCHLYDNCDLTFAEIKDVFQKASNGELKGTEKTDGQNLFVSYSVKDGKAKAARNKTNIMSGGLSASELADKFAGRGNLEKSFTEAFRAFEQGVESLPKSIQKRLFGADADIYYNAEVMDPRSPNVINYDQKSFVIHQVGHSAFDKETGERLDVDLKENVKILKGMMERIQKNIEGLDYNIYLNAVMNLKALDDDKALNDATAKLEKLMYLYDLTEEDTVGDLMIARIAPMIERNMPDASEETVELVIQRVMGEKVSLRDIYKTAPNDKDTIREIVNNGGKISSQAIAPLEEIIHDFAVEMLRALESAYILDNRKEVKRLQSEIRKVIRSIESSDDGDAVGFLQRQLKKLKDVANFATAAEGFVFNYKGLTYKFTGNFAPVNQLLGLYKYGRGSIPAMIKEEEQGGREIAVIPGAFKPPHAGHFDMIKKFASMAEQVVVFMSPLPRTTPDGSKITFDKAKKVWDIYLEDAGLDNVRVLESPVNSPVGSSFHFIANDDNNPDWAMSGDRILLGVSTKGGDQSRFGTNAQQYAKEGVDVKVLPVTPTNMQGEFKDDVYSASDMRDYLDDKDVKSLSWYIPDDSAHRVEEIIQILTDDAEVVKEEKQNFSSSILKMVSNVMSENTSAGGGVQGFGGAFGAPRKKKKLEEEDIIVKGGEIDINIKTMPQIAKEKRGHFIEWVLANDVRVQKGKIPVGKLKPTQMQIKKSEIERIKRDFSVEELQTDMPIIIGNDNHILDGHHRWYTLRGIDPKKTIKAYRVDKNIDELVEFAKDYPHVSYKRTN
jgi:cytidyltransferase-like protein